MKIAAAKKIIVEDFPAENRDLIKRLSGVLNQFLDQISQCVSNNLTLKDNIKGKVYTIFLAKNQTTYKLKWDVNEKPTAVFIGQITKNNKEVVTDVYALSWLYNSGFIELTFLGLTVDTSYDATIVGIV